MYTIKEIMTLLKDNYSTEEILEIISPKADVLVDSLEEVIIDNYDAIMERLEEDGYYEEVS